MKYQAVKGMKDIVPGEIETWQALEVYSRRFLEAHGFREIRTPILESTELFGRSIGEASDIVHKEMYTFEDRGGRSLTLRPEMTASVVRASLEHNLIKQEEPLFLYYIGSMYRAERPQAGRKREFYQIGVETLNTHSVINDAELIILAKNYLEGLGLSDFEVKVNNLGTEADRKKYSDELLKFFKSHQNELCGDCQFRLQKNVLRIFDCKSESCKPIIAKAPSVHLSSESKSDFDNLVSYLKKADVPFRIEQKLVRGLDYYTSTVFEVTSGKGLGSQDALLAGGRYDGLIKSLGGPAVGASGFALGVERLLMALEASQVSLAKNVLKDTIYIAGLVENESSCEFYRKIASELAALGKRAHYSFGSKNLGNHLKRASKMGTGFALIVGEDEYKAGEVTLKNMENGSQKRIKLADLKKAF